MRSGGVFAVDGNHMLKPFGGWGVRRSAARVGGVADGGPECVFSYAPIIGGHASRRWDASFRSPPPEFFAGFAFKDGMGRRNQATPAWFRSSMAIAVCRAAALGLWIWRFRHIHFRTCSTVRKRIPIAVQAAWQPSLVLRRICEGIPDVACGHVPQDSSKIWEPSCRSARLPRNLPLYNPLRLSFFIGYHRRR